MGQDFCWIFSILVWLQWQEKEFDFKYGPILIKVTIVRKPNLSTNSTQQFCYNGSYWIYHSNIHSVGMKIYVNTSEHHQGETPLANDSKSELDWGISKVIKTGLWVRANLTNTNTQTLWVCRSKEASANLNHAFQTDLRLTSKRLEYHCSLVVYQRRIETTVQVWSTVTGRSCLRLLRQ